MANLILNTPGGAGQVPASELLVGAKNNNGTVVNGFTDKLFVIDLENLLSPAADYLPTAPAKYTKMTMREIFDGITTLPGYSKATRSITPYQTFRLKEVHYWDLISDYTNNKVSNNTADSVSVELNDWVFYDRGTLVNTYHKHILRFNNLTLTAGQKYNLPIACFEDVNQYYIIYNDNTPVENYRYEMHRSNPQGSGGSGWYSSNLYRQIPIELVLYIDGMYVTVFY
jgi:hypothetical protein